MLATADLCMADVVVELGPLCLVEEVARVGDVETCGCGCIVWVEEDGLEGSVEGRG